MSIGTFNAPDSFETTGDHDQVDHGDFDQYQDQAEEQDQTEEQIEAEEGGDEGTSKSSKAKTSRKRTGPDRALIRRVATKSVELAEADRDDVALLATLLGAGTEQVDLTVAVMTAPRGATSALSDVKDLAGADGAERAVLAMTMGKPRMKALWAVLEHLDAVNGSLPASDAKAALALAEVELGEAALARLDRVADLAKRG